MQGAPVILTVKMLYGPLCILCGILAVKSTVAPSKTKTHKIFSGDDAGKLMQVRVGCYPSLCQSSHVAAQNNKLGFKSFRNVAEWECVKQLSTIVCRAHNMH